MSNDKIKIISSQRYLDESIVAEKVITGPICLPAYAVEIDGVQYAVLADGHHRRAAAIEAGVEVSYEIKSHPEYLTGEALLEAMYNDSDYYDIETGSLVF